MAQEKLFLLDYDLEELSDLLTAYGEEPYRAAQIWNGVYQNLWQSPDDFTTLPRALRAKLQDQVTFSHLTPRLKIRSQDDLTLKTLFDLPDGKAIEAVLMRYRRGDTVCISTQSGCAIGCVFCATGQMGFGKNLSSGEIIEQVLYFNRVMSLAGERLRNIVVMGMGEPFHNYEATMAAIDRLNHPKGFNLGARRFTISTVGIVPQIRRFAHEHRQINLAVSLHAADDALRSALIPINRKYPLDELFTACEEYVNITRRRITFEWALIEGLNDTLEQALKFANRVKGLLCHVNLIPLNPTRGYSGAASSSNRALQFSDTLKHAGISCTIRARRGIEIEAGCGQLAIHAKPTLPQVCDQGTCSSQSVTG